ncbi:helix-turn-helix domain-containing protein [Lysobacter sp. CA196]|uniref:helix-turn-helix domain-containing protein n=1 Tax=Lysobacter sp. CA196 TaxID=3455606 RepID=UPI003F8D1D5B
MSAEPSLPASLHPWIERIWVCERPSQAPSALREHSLPNGAMHLVVRLDGPPLRLYADADDRIGRRHAAATVAGIRAAYCIKDTSAPAASVGAVLRPGAALALFGVSAAELAGQHVPLGDLCGSAAGLLYERLAATGDAQARRRLFERFLQQRLRPQRGLDPQIVQAATRLERESGADEAIAAIAEAGGRSHRHFIAGFRDAVGLAPKRYARVQRFRRLLAALSATPRPAWAQLALDHGYFDQSHLIGEFREFAGVSPREYLAAPLASPHHLPIRPV